jgi:hypothetical protein
MGSNPFVIGIMAVAIINGIFSPFFVVTSQVMISAIMPFLLLAGASLLAFFGSLMAATVTIIIAGIPAALFERATGRKETDAAAYSIWLVTTIVISFPGILRAVALAL